MSKHNFLKLFLLLFFAIDDDEEDNGQQLMEELLQDPIFQTSMEENLTKFLQNFSRDDHFREFTEHLTAQEKLILQGIQVTA